jgi:hypothetical protein
VVVVTVVPFTCTETPSNGLLDSSVILPVTVKLFCENAMRVRSKNVVEITNCLQAIFFFIIAALGCTPKVFHLVSQIILSYADC